MHLLFHPTHAMHSVRAFMQRTSDVLLAELEALVALLAELEALVTGTGQR